MALVFTVGVGHSCGQAHHTDSDGLLVDEEVFRMMEVEAGRLQLYKYRPQARLVCEESPTKEIQYPDTYSHQVSLTRTI